MQKMIDDLRMLGIASNDTVLVHSSYKSLGGEGGSPQDVIEALIEALKEGTLLMPALSFENVNKDNPVFDAVNTESCVGILPETFRKMPGVYRSVHPTHSVCAYGKHAKEMTEKHYLDTTPVGKNSPFTLLKQYSGKILMLGCGLEPNTLIHGVEECIGTPYVLTKEETVFDIVFPDGKQEKASHIKHHFHDENGKYVHQRYERLLQVVPIRGGMVLNAVAYPLDANIVWQAVADKIKEDCWFFVDKEEAE